MDVDGEASAEDEVVAELDVFSSRTLWGHTTKLCLLQYPLRPLWRPYELDSTTKMRVKPQAGRVAITVPLDTDGPSYNEDAQEALKLKHLTLQSQSADLTTTHALGVVRGGKLYLMPVDEAYQMRPHMAHLDEPGAKPSVAAMKAETASDELSLLTVQVQRRETERQAQIRMKSHAYRSKLEADEDWIDIKFRDLSTDENVWSKLEAAGSEELPMNLGPSKYLNALLPASIASQQPDDDQKLVEAHRSAGEASTADHVQQVQPAQPPNSSPEDSQEPDADAASEDMDDEVDTPSASSEELKQLAKALEGLYRHGPVISLHSIRTWVTTVKPQASLERLSKASDDVLHHAVMQTELNAQHGDLYVQISNDTADVNAFRKTVLALLADKESVRKAEVVKACQAARLDISEGQCSKLLKELCQSRGASWFLRESTIT